MKHLENLIQQLQNEKAGEQLQANEYLDKHNRHITRVYALDRAITLAEIQLSKAKKEEKEFEFVDTAKNAEIN